MGKSSTQVLREGFQREEMKPAMLRRQCESKIGDY